MSEPQTIPAEKLCALTGLTDRRHRQLAKDGYFPPPVRGLYQLAPTVQGLFRYYREQTRRAKEELNGERAALLRTRHEREKEELAILRRLYEPKKTIAEKLRAIGEELKATLQFKLLDQLPALNAGQPAPKQREINREVFTAICERFQTWAKQFSPPAAPAPEEPAPRPRLDEIEE